MVGQDVWEPVLGPVDREHFDRAQRRNRRAAGRTGWVAAFVVLLMGVPLSIAISPLVLGLLLVGSDLLNLVTPTPSFLFESNSAELAIPITNAVVAGVVLLVVPGALIMLGAWLAVRRLLRRWGPGAELLAMGARPPRAGDLEEHQLENLVAEMAIAAGARPPAAMLIDSPVANAAAVGTSIDDGTIVVTRGLLDDLDRAETQGVIAHLIGSVGNGDLHVARTMSSVCQALGLIATALGAWLDATSRKRLRAVIAAGLRPSRRRDPVAATELASMLLDAHRDAAPYDEPKGCLRWIGMPFIGASMAFGLNQMIVTMLFVNPLLRRSWRSRRYEADATAVELTRNPDAVAKGLAALTSRGGVVPGTEPVAYLFVVGPEAGILHEEAKRRELQSRLGGTRGLARYRAARAELEQQERAAKLGPPSGPPPGPGRVPAVPPATGPRPAANPDHYSDMVGWQPPIDRRLARLRRLGATIRLATDTPPVSRAMKVLGFAVVAPFVALFYALMLALLAACLAIGLAVTGIFFFGPALVLHGALRGGG